MTTNVLVVDDEEIICTLFAAMLGHYGCYHVMTMTDSRQVMDFLRREPCDVMLLDMSMPAISGLDVLRQVTQAFEELPVIIVTGHGSIPMCAQVMKAGAADFLPKPFKPRELLQCVERALSRSTQQRYRAAEKNDARKLLDLLTPREFEVMQLVTTGLLNKQIGAELGIAEKTVKVHRGRVMQKLGVPSVAELMKVVQRAGVASSGNGGVNG